MPGTKAAPENLRDPVPATGSESIGEALIWTQFKRISFRLCFMYLMPTGIGCLYVFSTHMSALYHSPLWRYYRLDPWQLILPWIASHLVRIQISSGYYPEGDSLASYLQHAVQFLLASLGTVLWTLLDRKRPDYLRLYAWFTLFLRLALSITLLTYGLYKVFPLQFGFLDTFKLSQQVGELSLFNLMWTFMAASKGYTIFSGLIEVVAGLLLLPRRVASLGALLALIVMSNVFLLNLAYNIPVKLFSFHLLLISVFLAAPALKTIVTLLVFNRPATPAAPIRLSNNPRINRAVPLIMATIVLLVSIACTYAVGKLYFQRQAQAAVVFPYKGAWTITQFTMPDSSNQPLFTQTLAQPMHLAPGEDHWTRLIFNSPNELLIHLGNGEYDTVDLAFDSTHTNATITDSGDPKWKAALHFQSTGQDLLTMQGTINNVPVKALLHRENPANLKLTTDSIRLMQDQ